MTNEMQDKTIDERREFFRIDDSIQVSYRIIEPGEQPANLDDQHLQNDRFTVMTRLQTISQRLSAPLHRIEQRDPDVAEYLRALDDKINLLGQSYLAESSELLGQPSLSVNLSAGGVAMDVAEPLALGDRVEIKLLLLPAYTGVVAYGEVVGVEGSTEGNAAYPHHVRINFTLIRESDREALIRHIMRRQGEMLRQRRLQRGED